MKRPTNLHILLYLILAAFAFEVVVLARQNMILKRQLSGSRREIRRRYPMA